MDNLHPEGAGFDGPSLVAIQNEGIAEAHLHQVEEYLLPPLGGLVIRHVERHGLVCAVNPSHVLRVGLNGCQLVYRALLLFVVLGFHLFLEGEGAVHCGHEVDLALVVPADVQDGVISVGQERVLGFELGSLDLLWDTLSVEAKRAAGSHPTLSKLLEEGWGGEEVVHVDDMAFPKQGTDQAMNYLISQSMLSWCSLLAQVQLPIPYVAGLGVCHAPSFEAPFAWLERHILHQFCPPLEWHHALVNRDLLPWAKISLPQRDKQVSKGLDLVALVVAVVTPGRSNFVVGEMEEGEDSKESISGRNLPEARHFQNGIDRPVHVVVRPFANPHHQQYCHELLHFIHSHRFPLPNSRVDSCHAPFLLFNKVFEFVTFGHNEIQYIIIEEKTKRTCLV